MFSYHKNSFLQSSHDTTTVSGSLLSSFQELKLRRATGNSFYKGCFLMMKTVSFITKIVSYQNKTKKLAT